ncbi:HNH endonuclease, partial [Streptomyces caeruleatus]
YTCQRCFVRGGKLQIHHTIPVFENKLKAFDLNNLEPLCKICHNKEHDLHGHPKIWRQKHRGNKLSIKWTKIEKIEFMGNK